MTLLATLLIGIVAGSRSMIAPAAVAWAARLGWIDLSTTWAAFMGCALGGAALLGPGAGRARHRSAPDHPQPQGAGAVRRPHRLRRLLRRRDRRGFGGAVLGLVAGAIGAVIGTLGGAELRGRMAAAFGSDRPAALIEDAVAIVVALCRREPGVTPERFDDVVIGGGQAGPSLAVRLAGAGRRVAIVERRHLGGTCVNTGCRPTKTLIASARVAAMARRAGRLRHRRRPGRRRHAGGAWRGSSGSSLEARQGQRDWLTRDPGRRR